MSFSFSQLSEPLRRSLKAIGFLIPTPIQEKAIPKALEGKDLLIQAQTGTGKTGAFGIPIVEKIQPPQKALIIAPTRELAIQIRDNLRKISKSKGLSVYALYGGTPVSRDLRLLQNKIPDIIVGTPGRLKDLISKGVLKTDNFAFLVLDEMDVMLDMGFREDIEWIVSRLPKSRQTFLASATVPPEILSVAKRLLKKDFVHVFADSPEFKPRIKEIFLKTLSDEEKLTKLESLLRKRPEKAIVFVKKKTDAKDLAHKLRKLGFRVEALHGDMTQRRREVVMKSFREGKVNVLVATDVASRGLDVEGVSLIVNFHLPEDPKVYTHRIGRTARFGGEGTAVSLVSPSERKSLWRIKRFVATKGTS